MIKRKKKSPEQIEQNKKNIERRNELFLSIWENRPRKYKSIHQSEVSGEKIHGECRSTYMHHILPKNRYPQAEFDEENIIILTQDEHSKVENDMYKYEEINRRREKLKKKYNIL